MWPWLASMAWVLSESSTVASSMMQIPKRPHDKMISERQFTFSFPSLSSDVRPLSILSLFASPFSLSLEPGGPMTQASFSFLIEICPIAFATSATFAFSRG